MPWNIGPAGMTYRSRRRRNSNPLGFAIGLMIIGAILFFISIFMLTVGAQSESWVATEGTVTTTWISEDYDSKDKDYTYYAEIEYSFTVDGKQYSGSKWDPTGMKSGSSYRSEAENKLRDYPIGGKVTVYYDPAKPSNNALSKGVNPVTYVLLVVSIIMVLVGVAILIAIGKIFSAIFGSGRMFGRSNRYNQNYASPQGYQNSYQQNSYQNGGSLQGQSVKPKEDTSAWFGSSDQQEGSQPELSEPHPPPTTLDDSVASAPEYTGGLFMSKKACTNCGTKNSISDKFCGECGTPL